MEQIKVSGDPLADPHIHPSQYWQIRPTVVPIVGNPRDRLTATAAKVITALDTVVW